MPKQNKGNFKIFQNHNGNLSPIAWTKHVIAGVKKDASQKTYKPPDFWKFWNYPQFTQAIWKFSKIHPDKLFQISLVSMWLLVLNNPIKLSWSMSCKTCSILDKKLLTFHYYFKIKQGKLNIIWLIILFLGSIDDVLLMFITLNHFFFFTSFIFRKKIDNFDFLDKICPKSVFPV